MGDDDFQILHVVEHGRMKHSSSITVYLSADYNRKTSNPSNEPNDAVQMSQIHSDINIEDSIEAIWKERVLQNPRLFNGTKFRIHDVTDSEADKGRVNLYLGVTDYKDFIGTNWSPNAKHLQHLGLAHYGNSQAFMSDALGVGASVVTRDNKLILLKRSSHCGEAPSMWDVPGGHAEPAKLVGEKSYQEIDIASMSCSLVLDEIFDSITREVVDEVNIPVCKLSCPLYMGTHRNIQSAGRPSMSFVIKCELDSDEVQALYKQGSQSEAEETTNIMFLSLETVTSLPVEKNDLLMNFAPSAKGNLTTFCIAHGLREN